MDSKRNESQKRRRFIARQRKTLFLIAQGKCLRCGESLRPGWHADHKKPFSKGGQTELTNGQAYCPPCNLQKSDR